VGARIADDDAGAAPSRGAKEEDDMALGDSDGSSSLEDVTELMLAKRREQVQKLIDDSEQLYD